MPFDSTHRVYDTESTLKLMSEAKVDSLKKDVFLLREQLDELKQKTEHLEKDPTQALLFKRTFPTITQRQQADLKSVFVRGFPPQTTADELAKFFMQRVGVVYRSTILMNRQDGSSLGYAYIEFSSIEDAKNAILMNTEKRTMIFGFSKMGDPLTVELSVKPKRTNLPGFRRLPLKSRFTQPGMRAKGGWNHNINILAHIHTRESLTLTRIDSQISLDEQDQKEDQPMNSSERS